MHVIYGSAKFWPLDNGIYRHVCTMLTEANAEGWFRKHEKIARHVRVYRRRIDDKGEAETLFESIREKP